MKLDNISNFSVFKNLVVLTTVLDLILHFREIKSPNSN